MSEANHNPIDPKPTPRRRAANRPKAKPKTETVYGKKTLMAAIIAAVFAALDAYMTLRHGMKLPF